MDFSTYRVIQAPMAGTSTPRLTAAVSHAGAFGFVALAALGADGAAQAIAETRAMTDRPFGVNLFCHQPEARDPARDAAWLARLAPEFAQFGAQPPAELREIYPSLLVDDAMLRVVVAARPAAVSFHFGLPRDDQIAALRATGATLLATATSVQEARAIRDRGLDAVIAQGWQAGGHRGIFRPVGPDERLDTVTLVAMVRGLGLPVIAAGAVMTGGDVRAALRAGAVAVACGTAFLLTPEAGTTAAHREALVAGSNTVVTRAISGRPARCLVNRFTALSEEGVAGYPMAYDAGKALNAAASAAGEPGYGAFWAGTGAAQAQARPAAEVVTELRR